MSYVIFDVLHRYLEYRGYKVEYVQNFTDVDDKAIQRAKERGVRMEELVQEFIDDYYRVMDALNVQRADRYPRATEEIPRMIKVVQALMDRGYAYVVNDDVYFRVRRFERYGQLSGRNLDGMQAGARIEIDGTKEDPMDFVLWKSAKPGEPAWDSPWGKGRPGWHIECTAMSTHYLDDTLDIHGGGQDLVFPHHENEIAQSEAYTGKHPFAHFWVHNGLLQVGEEKMSKSLGNLVTVAEALSRHSADAWRLFFLSSHYHAPLAYVDESVAAAERGVERLRRALTEVPAGEGTQVDGEPFRHKFIEAMEDDLNTPQAIAALFDLVHEINRGRDEGIPVSKAQETLRELGNVLGLTFQVQAAEQTAAEPFVELLLETRANLRAIKQFGLADQIRNRLTELGVQLEDTPQGTHWHYRPIR
jgi:cysteinyl-tRNA synthetase